MNLPVTKYAAANQWCINYIDQQRAVKQLNSLALQTIAIKKASATPTDSSFLDKIKNIDFGALLQNPAVMAGLGSAAIGGGLTLVGDRKKNETRTGKALRALGNASVAGLLGGGAMGLLNKGTSAITTALPKEDIDPTTATVTHPLVRALSTVAGAGAAHKFIPDPYIGRADHVARELFTKLKNGVTDREAKKRLHEILIGENSSANIRAELSNLFNAKGSLSSLGPDDLRNHILGANTAENLANLKNDLRYLNIHKDDYMTLARLKSQLKGFGERAIDLKDIGGVGGQGFRLARGLGGAALGFAMPSIVAALSKHFQNKE